MNSRYVEKFYKTGDIELPEDDILIEILLTATKGTIAKVVGIEGLQTKADRFPNSDKYKNSKEIVTWDSTLIYKVEGRKQTGRIKDHYVSVLSGQYETKYVRDVKKHKKVKIKNPVNKFKQEMKRGDWVIGVRQGRKALGIGRITRWTNNNVWGVTGDDLDDKRKEFMFASIKETFTMTNDAVPLVTLAILKGWHGE